MGNAVPESDLDRDIGEVRLDRWRVYGRELAQRQQGENRTPMPTYNKGHTSGWDEAVHGNKNG